MPWAACKEVEWWARDAAWVCPVAACPVCLAAWQARDAAWAECRPVEWAADSAALPWAGSVVILVAGWAEPPWVDFVVRLWAVGSAVDSAADSAAGSAAEAAAWVEAAAAAGAAAVIAEKTARSPS